MGLSVDHILIPIRRIAINEILDFVDFVLAHSVDEYVLDVSSDRGLSDLVCAATLGHFAINVPREDRGLAALIRLKWGKEVDEPTSSAKPGE